MNRLQQSIFKSVAKKKSSLALFLLSFTPWLIVLVRNIETDFMQIEGTQLSLFDFLEMMFVSQQGLVIPIILLSYTAVNLLYDEIKDGQIFFYKDMNRNNILKAKYLTIYQLYVIYLGLFTTNIVLVYTVGLRNDPLFSGQIGDSYLYTSVFLLLLSVISDLLLINVSLLFGLRFNAGYTILGTLFVYMLSFASQNLKELSLFFPAGAKFQAPNISSVTDLTAQLLVPLFLLSGYSAIIYFVNSKKINKMDF